MNIVQNQAKEFLEYSLFEGYSYKTFIDKVRDRIYDYRKVRHKIIFIETLLITLKVEYDNHYKVCTDKNECSQNKFYENVL